MLYILHGYSNLILKSTRKNIIVLNLEMRKCSFRGLISGPCARIQMQAHFLRTCVLTPGTKLHFSAKCSKKTKKQKTIGCYRHECPGFGKLAVWSKPREVHFQKRCFINLMQVLLVLEELCSLSVSLSCNFAWNFWIPFRIKYFSLHG